MSSANAVAEAVESLETAVRKHAEASITDARLRYMARWMCRENGYDPDVITLGCADSHPCLGAKKTVAIVHPMQPQWLLYVRDAMFAIEALDAWAKQKPDYMSAVREMPSQPQDQQRPN